MRDRIPTRKNRGREGGGSCAKRERRRGEASKLGNTSSRSTKKSIKSAFSLGSRLPRFLTRFGALRRIDFLLSSVAQPRGERHVLSYYGRQQ